MKSVEHKRRVLRIPPVYWADEIQVLRRANDLSVSGRRRLPPSKDASRRNLLGSYLYDVLGRTSSSEKAAHLVFANSTSREALINFVEKYGPTVAEPSTVVLRALGYSSEGVETGLGAQQEWETLRREHRTFSAALQVLEQIRSEKIDPDGLFRAARELVVGTSFWVDRYERETEARKGRPWQDGPTWIWTAKHQERAVALMNPLLPLKEKGSAKRAVDQGHALLCHVLNGFPVQLTQYKGVPLEMPSEDVSFGILPVVYFLLRCDYRRTARVARCAWKGCTRWFRMGAHHSGCCSEEHSLKYRQWVYYRAKGKKTRQRRRQQLKREATK
jgi:hypothetical protein